MSLLLLKYCIFKILFVILKKLVNFSLVYKVLKITNSELILLNIYILIFIIVPTLLLSSNLSISVKLTPKIKNKVPNDSSFGNDYFERSILTNMRNDGYTDSPIGSKSKTPAEVINVPTVILVFLKVLNKLFEFTHYQIRLQLNITNRVDTMGPAQLRNALTLGD